MRRNVFFFVILLFALTGIVSAQNTEPEIWNWAWRQSTGEFFAYSSQGDVNTLLASGTTQIFSLWRIGNDHAVGLLQVNGITMFYDLTPQLAQTYTLNFDPKTLKTPFDIRYGYRLEAYSSPYMLFTPSVNQTSPPSEPAVLANLDTKQIEFLSNDVDWKSDNGCCRFSEDGLRLKYTVTSGYPKAPTLILRERVLATGEEKILYTLTGADLGLYPDREGERWLLYELKSNSKSLNDLYTVRMLHSDGTSEQIYEHAPDEFYTTYEFVGDDLISYQPLCEADCVLHLLTVGGDHFTFKLPPSNGGGIYFFQHIDDEHLVIGRLDDYWLLSTLNEPTLIGYFYRGGSDLPQTNSPDRRWLLMADTHNYPYSHRMVWDLLKQKQVVEIPKTLPDPIYLIYDPAGFIVDSLDTGEGILYQYADEKQFALPAKGYGNYFEALSDGSVLYYTPGQNDSAIYRYSPDENRFDLLMENVDYISTEDVNYYAYP